MNAPAKTIRVLLADHFVLVRAGIRALLEKLPEVEVVGEVGDGRDVLNWVEAHRADVVLMDLTMTGINGLETTERLAKHHPATRVIILSTLQDEECAWRALRAGAGGYLLKRAPAAELNAAVRQVYRGEIYISSEISNRLMKKFPWHRIASRKSPVEGLTVRQREVLQLIAEGQNTKGIAAILNLSPKTIEYHRLKLMERLDAHGIANLVRFALRIGLVSNGNGFHSFLSQHNLASRAGQ